MALDIFNDLGLPLSGHDWHLEFNTIVHTSPLDKSTESIEMPGAHWVGSVSFNTLNDAQLRVLQVFLDKLRGAAGRFYFSPLTAQLGSLATTGGVTVDGGSQVGTTINTAGWDPSEVGVLKAGDCFSFDTAKGREMKRVQAPVDSDATGKATITFEAPIRTAPADLAAIEIVQPTCMVMLEDDRQGRQSFRAPLFAAAGLKFKEAFKA